MYITQGFIAGTTTNQTTTLGREGSDYTAALLANLLDAEDVTIWKDVPGIMNADPKIYENTEIISKLSYKEAIELSNCGAKVIHPKTIKPLQNKGIPLFVRSFLYPESHGSVIRELDEKLKLPPIYINKGDQLLLTLSPRDFSFIAEEKLSRISEKQNETAREITQQAQDDKMAQKSSENPEKEAPEKLIDAVLTEVFS